MDLDPMTAQTIYFSGLYDTQTNQQPPAIDSSECRIDRMFMFLSWLNGLGESASPFTHVYDRVSTPEGDRQNALRTG